jgi:hypothetical protein
MIESPSSRFITFFKGELRKKCNSHVRILENEMFALS